MTGSFSKPILDPAQIPVECKFTMGLMQHVHAMELDQLEAFVAVVREGGFSRAAAILHLTQPAISRRIQQLEDAVGAPLFERIPAGVRLSAAGDALLPHAKRALAAAQDGLEAARETLHAPGGRLVVALVGTLANTDLSARLKRFRAQHPELSVSLRTALSAEVSEAVLCGEAHLGLRYFHDADPAVVSVEVAQEMLVVVGPAEGGPTDAESLRSACWLTFPTPRGPAHDGYAQRVKEALLRYGVTEDRLTSVDSLTAQKRLVEAGFGLSLLPASSIEEELRLGSLRVLEAVSLHTSLPICLIHRREAHLSRLARALVVALCGRSGSTPDT